MEPGVEPIDTDGLAVEVGRRIRALRTAAGLSGRKLAAAAGLSQPFLSQVESGRTTASLSSLYRIAAALNTPPAELLPAGAETDVELVRAPEWRMAVSDHQRAATAQAIFRSGKRITELYDYVIEPGEYVEEWFEAPTEHALYVIEGAIRVEFEERPEVLVDAGDALFYPARLRHRWHLASTTPARVLLVAVTV